MQTYDLYGVNHKLFGTQWPEKGADTPAIFLCSAAPVNCSRKPWQKCPASQEGVVRRVCCRRILGPGDLTRFLRGLKVGNFPNKP